MIVAASMDEFFVEGKIFTAASLKSAFDMFGEDECEDYFMEKNICFDVTIEDCVSMHLYNFESNSTINELMSGYPVAKVTGENITLYSLMGVGKENEIICKKVTCNTY